VAEGGAVIAKARTHESIAAELTVAERVMLFCIARAPIG
jgi:hypothetical protein